MSFCGGYGVVVLDGLDAGFLAHALAHGVLEEEELVENEEDHAVAGWAVLAARVLLHGGVL